MIGCPAIFACADACCEGELSQHPTWPHCVHRRRWTHQPPLALHSTQPVPLGGTAGSMPGISLIQLSSCGVTGTPPPNPASPATTSPPFSPCSFFTPTPHLTPPP